MPTYLFQELAKKAKRLFGSDVKMKSRVAIEWFREMARAITSANPDKMIKSAGAFEKVTNLTINSIGKMYMFSYDAKHKDTLPYWDKYPLIFVIDLKPKNVSNSILGINLHYLPPFMRAKLMDALYETMNNDKYNSTTKLQISYHILKGAAKYSYFKPCVKMYLLDHLVTPFISINPKNWDYALMLPLARFQKMNEYEVWMQSSLIAEGKLNRPMTARQRHSRKHR